MTYQGVNIFGDVIKPLFKKSVIFILCMGLYIGMGGSGYLLNLLENELSLRNIFLAFYIPVTLYGMVYAFLRIKSISILSFVLYLVIGFFAGPIILIKDIGRIVINLIKWIIQKIK